MGGFFGPFGSTTSSSGGGSAALVNRFTSALAAGANNNLTPAGFPGTKSFRLILTAPAGNANVTGLLAGTDGQLGMLTSEDAANTITLNALNAGSLPANRFLYAVDIILPPGASKMVCYDGTSALWLIA